MINVYAYVFVVSLQGVTVDESRVNDIKKLADKLISQGRTDVKFVQDKRDNLIAKSVSLLSYVAKFF